MTLISQRFVVPVSGQYGQPDLLVAVKRYTCSNSPPSTRGITLLLTHGVTFHKELWEPMLARLFRLQSASDNRPCIREAWAIDSPNHGESAALNAQVIDSGFLITYRDYARAVVAFLDYGLIDTRSHRIVAIGHSAGTAPIIWAADTWYYRNHRSPFVSMVLLEPPLISAALDAKYGNFNAMLAVRAQRRRNYWSSRNEAIKWSHKQQRHWDQQCLSLFSEYGLREGNGGVALSCTGVQEAACYNVSEQDEVLGILRRICARISIHTIFSEYVDLSPNHEIRENIVDAKQGRKMASVTWMPGVGHFALLENPEVTAHAVFRSLGLMQSRSHSSIRHQHNFIEARL
ncbi:Alpha/beta hydrolase fold-1 [Hysterangium stoloniferum]|nr:Alpha/beta hydrolase fold-1 [Hysterangium stoloniferum]